MRSLLRILFVFLLLLCGLIVAAMVFDDRGYVYLEFIGWAIQMNVMSLAISFIALFTGMLLVWWLINLVLNATAGSRNWLGGLGYRKRQNAFKKGLLALAENDLSGARDYLAKIEDEDFDGINLLAQAQTELLLNQPQKAQQLWQKASRIDASAIAAQLCLIRHALQYESPAKALSLIDALSEKQRNHPSVICLWAQALAKAGKWQLLKDKLPAWKKPLGAEYDNLAQQASSGKFAEIASKEGAAQLKQSWQELPRAARKDPAQQAAYIQQLLDQGMHRDAEIALVEYQKSAPQPLLLPLFKQIKLPNPSTAIKKLESWLKEDDSNPQLLSALGHLAYNAKDYILAEKALSRAIKLANQQQDLRLMARIKEQQQDQKQALQWYKQSLEQHDSSTQKR